MPEQTKLATTLLRYLGLAAVFLTGVITIIGSGGGGSSTPATITAVIPAQSTSSAVVTTSVSATFSIEMNAASFNASSFTLVDNSMTSVTATSITYNAANRTVTFVPDSDLVSGDLYTATITTAVQDAMGGNPLTSDYVWSFQIAPTLVPVSQDANRNYGSLPSSAAAIDESGRYLVFVSSNNLVSGINTGGITQIYRKDTLTGQIIMISTDTSGLLAGNGASGAPVISNDGRYVAFESDASNLVSGDSNSVTDVFRHDVQTRTTIRVSVASGGTQATGFGSNAPAISADGRYVAFDSQAANLVANDTNALHDVFLHDAQANTTIRVSVTTGGAQATGGGSSAPAISADGRYIAFASEATNLVAADTNNLSDIFLRDNQTPVSTTRVSVTTGGAEATGGGSTAPSISADGRYIAFASEATNLVVPDANGVLADVYLRDTTGSSTSRLSVNTAGAQDNTGFSTAPSISADGRYIAFESSADNLVTGDTNNTTDIFLRDTGTPSTVRLNIDENGAQTTLPSAEAVISANGRYIGFTTQDNLDVVNDTNAANDIYRTHRSHQ